MKTADTTEVSPSAESIPPVWNRRRAAVLADLKAPFADEPWSHQVAWIFDYCIAEAEVETQYVRDLVAKIDRHEPWSSSTLEDGLSDICRLIGLPGYPSRHEQPALLRQMFTPPLTPMSLHEYMHDPMDSQRPLEYMTPEMVILWLGKARRLANQLVSVGVPVEDRMRIAALDLQVIGIRMLVWMWPEGVVGRIRSLWDVSNFLRHTSGLFDPESGVLTDPEIAAEREFKGGSI